MGIQVAQTEVGDYETLPMGEYLGVITEIEAGEGQYGPNLKYVFRVSEGEYENEELWTWTSQKFSQHEKCVLMRYVRAVFGGEVPNSYQLDTDDLLNKPVIAKIGTREVVVDGKTVEKNKVLGFKSTGVDQYPASINGGSGPEDVGEEEFPF